MASVTDRGKGSDSVSVKKFPLDETLEDALRLHLGRYVEAFVKKHEGEDVLEAVNPASGLRIVDRDLLVAYLSLKTQREAAEDNQRLQSSLRRFAAISAGSAAASALMATIAVLLQAHVI